MLLEAGADKNQDSFYGTPLLSACNRGRTEVVRFLLEAGVDRDTVSVILFSQTFASHRGM